MRLDRFIILRDGYGSTQLIAPENTSKIVCLPYDSVLPSNYIYYLDAELSDLIKNTPLESVLMCYGHVQSRPVNQIKKVSRILHLIYNLKLFIIHYSYIYLL